MNSERYVALLLFDLPTATKKEARDAAKFRRELLKNGYLMVQESIYVKLLRTVKAYMPEKRVVDSLAPAKGSVIMFRLSAEAFANADWVRGTKFDMEFFASDYIEIA